MEDFPHSNEEGLQQLLHSSEEELNESLYYDKDYLYSLIRNSKTFQLAELFVKQPILQDIILQCTTDPIELYECIYGDLVDEAHPINNDYHPEGNKEIEAEYSSALNKIKDFVVNDPYFSETPIADRIWNAPDRVYNWDYPYGEPSESQPLSPSDTEGSSGSQSPSLDDAEDDRDI